MQLYKFFPHVAILRRQQVSNLLHTDGQVVQKWLGTYKVCAHQTTFLPDTGSKFSKIFLAVVYRWNCSCAPILLASDGATARAPNSKPHFLVNFIPLWGRIASPMGHLPPLSPPWARHWCSNGFCAITGQKEHHFWNQQWRIHGDPSGHGPPGSHGRIGHCQIVSWHH